MKLNPIADTSLEGVKEFTDVIANVSSLIIDPSYADAWKMVQKVKLCFLFFAGVASLYIPSITMFVCF